MTKQILIKGVKTTVDVPDSLLTEKKKCIIHKLFYSWKYGFRTPFYLCNQAYYAKESNSSYFWGKVTCKNCLKQRNRSRIK